MEEIRSKLKSLDNVQLRAELLKQGEKVGPVTPSTREVFLSRLAKKLYVEHPSSETQETPGSETELSVDKEGVKASDSVADAKEPGGLSTPTGRKGMKNGMERDACVYYVVIMADSTSSVSASVVSDSVKGTVPDHRVFTEKQEALAFMKKNAGRLKVFQSSADVKQFVTQFQQSEDSGQTNEPKADGTNSNNLALEAEKSAFKGPKVQELLQFRRLVEKGDTESVKMTVWSNPRYLITGADTPVILHEGMRHNAMHIAAKSNQAEVARLVLETILDPDFTKLLYSSTLDTKESRSRRITYLSDLYLNSPDKVSAESPLHIACKMGHPAMVHILVMFSATDRTRTNKYGEKPEEIICSRYRGDNAAEVKGEIQELVKGLCLVPLLRSVDNITVPVVGTPCSPDDKIKQYTASSAATPSLTHSPREPRLTLSAYAGPMSPSKAREFQKQWTNPRSSKNTDNMREFTMARRADAEKGYERIGRKLAKELKVPWTEYWQFLDVFADFSTQDGLRKLEQHLVKQQIQLAVLSAMDSGSSDEESASTGSSEEDSQEECFYSCDEDSVDEKHDNRNASNCQASYVELANEEGEDVFEESLDSFFDTRSYVFGQRLQLKKTVNNNDDVSVSNNGKKTSSESTADISTTQKKHGNRNSDLWSYRDNMNSGEEERKASETSFVSDTTRSFDASTSDTTRSFDASSPSTEDSSDQPEQKRTSDEKIPSTSQTPAKAADKSFNTVMTELSDDLDTKLIFSPEGKVVSTKRHHLVPDVGLCLDKDTAKTVRQARKGHVDVLIKSRKGTRAFLADVLVHSSSTDIDDSFDDSDDDLSQNTRYQVFTNVRLMTRSDVVFQYVRRLLRPVHLTVGILETGVQDVALHCGCVNARIVRRKRSRSLKTACYVYGTTACKTDLDVMRAMCEADVDPTVFPAVHSWLSLVSSTQQKRRDSWLSPARLRHQHRLSMLQQKSMPGSPLPVSPLVDGGTLTSTPVSRSSHHSLRTNPDLSPNQSTRTDSPRAWLFKSST
ncbi:hypothetical protein ACOMHN_035360 [Nucella lapillus]